MPGGIKYNDPAPLYEQIANDLKRLIKDGKIKKGCSVGISQPAE